MTAEREDYVELRVPADRDPETILRAALDRGFRVLRFEITEPSLEEIFIEHVGRRAVDEDEEHLATTAKEAAESSGLFPNLFHVARREYLVRVRGRAFVITTALLAVAVIGLTLVPTILAAAGVADQPAVVLVDEAGDLPVDPVTVVQSALAPPEGSGGDQPTVVLEDDPEAAEGAVRDGTYDALLTITRTADGEVEFEFLGSASPTNQTRPAGQYRGTADRRRGSAEPGGRDSGPGLRDLRPSHLRRGADRSR